MWTQGTSRIDAAPCQWHENQMRQHHAPSNGNGCNVRRDALLVNGSHENGPHQEKRSQCFSEKGAAQWKASVHTVASDQKGWSLVLTVTVQIHERLRSSGTPDQSRSQDGSHASTEHVHECSGNIHLVQYNKCQSHCRADVDADAVSSLSSTSNCLLVLSAQQHQF